MYAVIFAGGKQYKVKEGQTLDVELLDLEEGAVVDFDQVLMLEKGDDNIILGAPYVEGAKVSAQVVGHGRAKKIDIIKFKRRKHHMKRMGHRQYFTTVKITGIQAV